VPAKQHVLPHTHAAEQRQVLKGAADAQFGYTVTGQTLQRLPVKHDGAALEVVQAGQAVEQGGLAGPVGADQADDLTRVDLEGNAVQGDDTAEAHADIPYR
jgi:hypothetical protein